jgi:two-component system, cell cycle sensor histidine kinase and response regulator CckA
LIQYVNQAFETVTGYTREEVRGQNPRILKSGNQDESFYRDMWATLTGGNTFHGRMINKRKDGSLYTEDATISPVRDAAGHIVNYVAVKRDVTAHIQLENQLRQAQKMESVGRLAGGVAHDYNNMLSVILGYTEMAIEQVETTDPLYVDLKEVYNAGKRSMDITGQLLAFARKQLIAPKVLDLNETLEEMLKILRRLIGEDIHLEWHPQARLWPVKMDPSQIDQILANLCVNARDAIADVGKITIETENITFDADYCENHVGFIPGDFVMLAVSDNGCGMDKETLANLFEPFFTTKEMGKGTGLGLATVYGIVKQNNGFINVYSEPGQGTTFKIYLPRHAGEIEETFLESAAELLLGMGEIVLLVEDEPIIIKMGKMMLENLGYQVLTAETPGRAFDLAAEHIGKIDLLMTDVVMPEMNGRDLAEKLQALYPDLKVLFMSGYTANVIAHHGVLDADVHFIQKPFSMKKLSVKVREALEGAKSS